jgi:hypothetical protein
MVKNAVEVRKDKEKFEQARTSLDKVYADIVATVGSPDNFETNSSCSRPNQEFGQGPLSCVVQTSFVYGVNDLKAAGDLMQKTQSTLDKSSDFKNKIKGAGMPDTLLNSSSQSDSYEVAGIKCSVKYVYDIPRETFLKIKDSSQKTFQVSLGCPDSAKAEYFPLEN